ncbi:MAG: putative Bifunctional protein FolD [Streblomastix strix]|uniref:Putative Bifunctional protein FolD n=1 Tax=Streblomastix strix TaxID=222440 RepID=A0A5J4X0G5_9EUKA|nr:MAG: putative Bifunctional protein FolD [Streblomastix strix]
MTDKVFIHIPKLLLPKPENRSAWPVVACDQFTSEPEYWESVKKEVGDKPSMLRLTLPELYLNCPEEEKMIGDIVAAMKDYTDKQIFEEIEACVYVERKTRKTPCRRGIVLALDLEAYNYDIKAKPSPIRPTEMTVVERIPPRLRVRSQALIESPHILILIDDPERKIIEPLTEEKGSLKKLYDQELMLGAGHITGYEVPSARLEPIVKELERLADPAKFEAKYGVKKGTPVLLFAVGDGNHSLATAKKSWEDIKSKVNKKQLPDLVASHPARYCMVELENIYDEGIEFEPIHRVLFGVKQPLLASLEKEIGKKKVIVEQEFKDIAELHEAVEKPSTLKDTHHFGLIEGGKFLLVAIPSGKHTLPVGAVTEALDSSSVKKQFAKIDYIHGDDVVMKLVSSNEKENVGIVLPLMQKTQLFPTVIKNNRLPRKTFSMGEADEKRFYFECRKIVP